MNGQNVLSLSNHEAAKRMAYVSQFSEISRLTVFDTVLLGRKTLYEMVCFSRRYGIVQSDSGKTWNWRTGS
mgnify:CR=1 FL=1